jgi:glycerate kinase
VPGFEVVADTVELADRIEGADLVVTGEGVLDEASFDPGKAVGGVVALAVELGVPVLVIAGEAVSDQPVAYQSLVERFGPERASADVPACVTELVADALAAH